MANQQLISAQAPELITLCRWAETTEDQLVGWAMLVGERVVAYVPEHPRIAGGSLLNTYMSLDNAERLLAYAGIHSVREWAALLDEPAGGQRATDPRARR